MTQKDNILQELKELNSGLAGISREPVYAVPAGYFDGLASRVLGRIKAMEADNAADELAYLAPGLKLSKQLPYSVPQGYFEGLAASMLAKTSQEESPASELESLSPLLSQLKKESRTGHPYSVPAGYFETLGQQPYGVSENKPAKVISLSVSRRTWFRAAVAAVVTGIIVMAGYLLLGEKEPGGKALAKFTRDVKKMDDSQKENLIHFIEAGLSGQETAQVNTDSKAEVKNLLEGISEEELKSFQQQSEDIQDVLMTE